MKYYMEVLVSTTWLSFYDESIDDDLSAWVDVDPSEMNDQYAEDWFKAAYWSEIGEDAIPENRPYEADEKKITYEVFVYPEVSPEEDEYELGHAEEFICGYSADEWELWEERFGDDDIVLDECGNKYRFSEVSALMDAETLERIRASRWIRTETKQQIFDAYCADYRDTHKDEEFSDGKWVYYADFTRKLDDYRIK